MANGPKKVIKVGDVSVGIWENYAQKDGKTFAVPNITLCRMYHDKEGHAKFTSGFRKKDLLCLERAIREAFEILR